MRRVSSFLISNAFRAGRERFRGLRCLHTHLRGEELTQDDLTDLALLRLDLMASIDVEKDTGLPGLVRAAHLMPGGQTADRPARIRSNRSSLTVSRMEPGRILRQVCRARWTWIFFSLMGFAGRRIRAKPASSSNRQDSRDRAILVSVTSGSLADAEESNGGVERACGVQ